MKHETRRGLLIFLILLFGPWGGFLLVAPPWVLNLTGEWWGWRYLGGMSIVGGLIYSYAYFRPEGKWTNLILKFAVVDNFIPVGMIGVWGVLGRMPWVFWAQVPVMLWLGWVFNREARVVKIW